jgi:chromosome partitioning protein
MAKVFSVVSTKGGVGKTVTAVHIAAYLSRVVGGKTLLVDGDATRSATLWSKPGHLPFKVIPERGLSRELTEAKYDYLVLDTEANPSDADLGELATACDLAIIPSSPDALGLHSVLQTAEKLNRFAPNTPYRVLLTIVPPKPNRDREEAEVFLDEKKLPRFEVGIRRLIAFQRAVIHGVTVDEVDRSNLGWRDYEQVSREALQVLGIHIPD